MLLIDDEEDSMKNSLRDWRTALRTPTAYRVGNRTLRIQTQFISLVSALGVGFLFLFYYNSKTDTRNHIHRWSPVHKPYNATYPLTPPIKSGDMLTYRIGIVADMDKSSLSDDKSTTWISYLKKGYLSYSPSKKSCVVTWDTTPSLILSSSYALKGRGMELSELVVYDGRLLTFDDRSGMVFEIIGNKIYPWVILIDGNGKTSKGFKSEWATVRGEVLYVGSMGKEWTTASGLFESYDPMYVKLINMFGEVRHENWANQYRAIRSAIGINWPGYMIHESGAWSQHKNRWTFLPRRCSTDSYNETKDETKGCNVLITANEDFSDVEVVKIGPPMPTHGFSSFKFIPGSNDEAIIALRTVEYQGATSTFIMAFLINGEIIMEETLISSSLKFEGLEFI